MTIEVKKVPPGDLYSWVEAVSFANSGEVAEQEWRDLAPIVEPERTFGAYDGAQIVGGGSIVSFEVTVPGGATVPAAGITGIGIMPTHRRRGALRQLMARMLEDAAAHHEPLAALWASEGSIYSRFGYGMATTAAAMDLERDRAVLVSSDEPFGTVRLINADEALRVFPFIFEANRARIPGFFSRTDTWWKIEVLHDFKWARRGFDKKFYALHETDGRADAYALYRARQEWTNSVPGSELAVVEIMALDGNALREMWRFLFGIDLIEHITTRNSSPHEPLLLMLAEPRRVNLCLRDGMWLRIVDVAAALERRAYSTDGTVVLEVNDDFLPHAGGRFRLTTSAGRGTVVRTDYAADIELNAPDLGAVYLGGFTLADLARAGRTRELASGARARADAMLYSPAAAWCPEIF